MDPALRTVRSVVAAFASFAALFTTAGPAAAQEAADDVVNIVVPQARHNVILPHPHRHQPVRLADVRAEVSINDQVATTTLVLTLTNPSGVQQEAELLVPVPEGVTVRSFGIDSIGGGEPTARILPRDEARRVYESIVSSMRDPGLLEFAGYSHIRTSVFPVAAHGTNAARLTYEQLLPADTLGGAMRVDYVLPRSGAIEQSGTAWSISMDLRGSHPISTVYSPSHDISTERKEANRVVVSASGEAAASPGAIRVSYLLEPADADGPAATFLAYPDREVGGGDGGYFLMLAGLPAELPGDAEPVKRQVILVLDRSGSMGGQKIEQARKAALQVLEGLRPGEAFNIIDYSDSVQMFAEHPVLKNEGTIGEAREYIAQIQANGGTNIHDALLAALRQERTGTMLPVVLFLTDGLPTVGRTSEREIREAAEKSNEHGRRIFTFGVGYDVNAPLLGAIAAESRAASTFVLPEEDVEVKVGQVFRRLSGPILAAPTLAAVDASGNADPRAVRELQPGTLPDLFEGDQLLVLGQYTSGAPVKLRLSGEYLGQRRAFDFSFDPSKASAAHGYVPRLWAGRKIAALIDQIRRAAADGGELPEPQKKELIDEIVRLSTRFGILTEYTSFLATEPGREDRALVPMESALEVAAGELRRAERGRAGAGGVRQQQNVAAQTVQANTGEMNAYYAESGERVRLRGVQQVADRALFRRGDRWVDGRLLEDESAPPERTVEFGTPEYAALLDRLVAENRQGLLALGGEVYLLVDGRRTLVKNPAGE